MLIGTPYWTRASNQQLRRLLLYPLELTVHTGTSHGTILRVQQAPTVSGMTGCIDMADISQLADDMASAIKGSETSTAGAAFGGLLAMPQTLGYLAYDYLDTSNRHQKDNDKIRLMYLIKNGHANREAFYEIARIFISNYLSKLTDEQKHKLYINFFAYMGGKAAGNLIIFSHMNAALASGFVKRLYFGIVFTTILSIGAEQSKAVYVSRGLMVSDPTLYWKLRSAGDLDLLYFLVEDYLKPFEEAAILKSKDEAAFNQLVDLYLQKMAE